MAGRRVEGAARYIPDQASLDELRAAAAACHGCGLYEDAEQTVFGAGSSSARIVFVGEQPGDQEDRAGTPFVGPAGKIFDRALADAGLDRTDTYVTNAVKHFKFTRRGEGKRRIHERPNTTEVSACRPWLDAEFGVIKPELVVLLGATAAKALLGASFRVTRQRGKPITPEPDGLAFLATIHPSAVLRAKDRDQVYDGLVADLRVVADLIT